MNHSYEEIRSTALDVLAGRETQPPYEPNQYEHLSIAVAEVFARREKRAEDLHGSRHAFRLEAADADLFLEVLEVDPEIRTVRVPGRGGNPVRPSA